MIKEIFHNILKSFNNEEEGYSSKKLTAFIITVMVVIAHIKWLALGDFTQLEIVLTIDYSFIAALFGMTTFHSISTRKSNNPDEPKK